MAKCLALYLVHYITTIQSRMNNNWCLHVAWNKFLAICLSMMNSSADVCDMLLVACACYSTAVSHASCCTKGIVTFAVTVTFAHATYRGFIMCVEYVGMLVGSIL